MTSGAERVARARAPRCLTMDEALDFAQGALSGSKLEAIDAHVDACVDCRELVIDALRGLNSGGTDSSSPPRTTMFQKGTVVGERFRIVRFIAKGGMGEVYEALDLELETTVALKTVSSLVADNERAVRYLKSEVLHARSIAHPNVCRIYEWGTHVFSQSSSRVHYFTMEFIRGERLGASIRREGARRIEDALDIARQLLAGLDAAHAAGVLHRDFKSDNVMISEVDGGRRVVILDFGLARGLDRDASSSSFGPVGTKLYMAPEQLEGAPLRPSADIYAFGVVLFEVLTGRRPFESEDGTEPPLACLKKTPAPPSRYIGDIPPGLDQFVLRCLRRQPLDRYQSARQARAALATVVQDPEVVKKNGPLPRLASILPAALILAGVLSAAGLASFWRSKPEPRPVVATVSPISTAKSPDKRDALVVEPARSPGPEPSDLSPPPKLSAPDVRHVKKTAAPRVEQRASSEVGKASAPAPAFDGAAMLGWEPFPKRSQVRSPPVPSAR